MKNLVIIVGIVLFVVGVAAGYMIGKGGEEAQPTTFTGGETTKTVTKTVTETKTVTKTMAGAGLKGTIKIGALLPLTGDLGSFGKRNEEAVKMAVEDFNKFLEKVGANWRLDVIVEDTETSKDKALEKLQILATEGVKAVVGPMSSSELSNIKNYADSNKILVVSQSSTAVSLALPNDYVFRLCTNDLVQGKVIAKMVHDDGKKVLIAMWRGDAWGDGLAELVKKTFKELGGVVDDGVRYDKEAADFSSYVDTLAKIVNKYLKQGYTKDEIAVVLISFDEVQQIFQSASQYDVLSQVKWYGSDGTAMSNKVTGDKVAFQFALKVKFPNTVFSAGFSPKSNVIRERLKERLHGESPDSYSLAAYDAVWLIGLTIHLTQKYDGEALKNAFPSVAELYFGATGWTKLDQNGDRAAADYEIWQPALVEGKPQWKLVGVYNSASDSFTWFESS